MGTTRPTTIGGGIAVSDSAALALLDARGLPLGTRVLNQGVGSYFRLTASTAALDPDVVVEVFGTVGSRWIAEPVVTGAVESVTGAGVDDSDPSNPVIVAADMDTAINAENDSLTTIEVDGNTITLTVDGDADGDYEMWATFVLSQNGATNTLSLRPNGLTTNQTGHYLLGAGTLASAVALTAWDLANGQQAGTDTTVRMYMRLTSVTGRPRIMTFQARYNPTGSSERFAIGQGSWSDTATNITSIVFNATQGIRATGSYVRLRKLRNLT